MTVQASEPFNCALLRALPISIKPQPELNFLVGLDLLLDGETPFHIRMHVAD